MFPLDESRIDWKALRVQKMYLLHLSNNRKMTHNEQAAIEGLINLLDYIQDQAVASETVDENIVFTYRTYRQRRMAENMGLPYYEEVDATPFIVIDTDWNWIDAFATRADAESARTYLISFGYEHLDIITGEEWGARLHGTETIK